MQKKNKKQKTKKKKKKNQQHCYLVNARYLVHTNSAKITTSI